MMLVPVKWLESVIDPLNNPPWPNVEQPISILEIKETARKFLPRPKQYDPWRNGKKETRQDHLNRIAFYYKCGWRETPIFLILKNEPNWCPLLDGFHRTCAAIARGDDMIIAEVLGPQNLIKQIYQFEEELLAKAS